MEKQKNGEQYQHHGVALALIILVVLIATGMLGGVFELVFGLLGGFIGLVVGLVTGIFGLVFGLLGGVLGLVFGLLAGVLGLVFGLLPVLLPIIAIVLIVKAINGDGSSNRGKAKRKNDEDYI